MNTELIQQLNECIDICNSIISAIELDLTDMRQSINGEVYSIYCSSCTQAIDNINDLKNRLYELLIIQHLV